jgi:hypothetical protein
MNFYVFRDAALGWVCLWLRYEGCKGQKTLFGVQTEPTGPFCITVQEDLIGGIVLIISGVWNKEDVYGEEDSTFSMIRLMQWEKFSLSLEQNSDRLHLYVHP